MIDLSTEWLGLRLAHPFVPGAGPLSEDLDAVRHLEDAGASAIVLSSLFEEQVTKEAWAAVLHLDEHDDLHAEASSYFPASDVFSRQSDAYLDRVRRTRAAVSVPVVASLNGTTPGGWLDLAKGIEQAGAHALELNLYFLPTDPEQDAALLEARAVETVSRVASSVRIPVAVKLTPFWTSLPHFARRLERAGARGLVLFNRLYQPDIDPETLDAKRTLRLSDSSELPLRLSWLAIVQPVVSVPLAVSGGVHTSLDAVKSVMAGASCVQMVSALLRGGPSHLTGVLGGFTRWMEEHEYPSVQSLLGCMSRARCPDPAAYERANYVHLLQSWHG